MNGRFFHRAAFPLCSAIYENLRCLLQINCFGVIKIVMIIACFHSEEWHYLKYLIFFVHEYSWI